MKNSILIKLTLCIFSVIFSQISFAQLPDGFDIKKAYQQAKDKGISASDIEGYVRFLHNDFLSHKGHNQSHSNNNASKNSGVYDAGTIYLGGGNINPYANKPGSPILPSPQNVYCPNAGFEQATFANWTGSYGTVVTGAVGSGFPTYTQTSPTIVNPAGNNVSVVNTLNYHTIMTTPATNSVYPNVVGWDSIACKVVGTQTVSEIPVVNPNGGPASVRLNGANSNYRASKLTYNMSLNPNNKNFSISYALILDNGGHNPEEQPYFSVKVTDQNGNLVPGCSTYTVTCNAALTNTASPLFDPSWTDAVTGWGGVMYRKWTSYAFDFSNYPAITSVNVEFYVGGCSQGGHYGYAYVDAACSPGGAVASFCANNNQAVLNAPSGYLTYQWLGPLGPISVPNGGNAATATITPVSAGQVFTCNVTSQNGCNSSFQTTVAISTVSITGVGSTPSCPNGNSGTANVSATGSSTGYNYQWVNSVGTTVSTAQTATGLSPGIYTINVTAVLCGAQSTTVQVGISAPTFYSLPAPYCGTTAWITNAGGSNYKWYTASPLALIAGANSSSLTINSPVNGAGYFLVFTTASGCKDSIKYILSQSPGGNIYTSNIKSICPGNNNSYAVINLQTGAPPVYSYTVTGPGGYSSILNNTTLVKDSVTGLSIGTYSATVFDGQCLYSTTFTVSPFLFSYTLTPTTSTICVPGTTSLSVNFGNTTPTSCGLSTTGGCTSPNIITIGTGALVNSSTSYPAIYGNFYNNTRHQILYLASELTAAGMLPGKISSLAFNITTINGISTYPNFTIKVKCTSVNDLTSSTFDNTGLVQVYFAASQNITTGWNTYPFTTAYEWDGVSNLLIDVCDGLTSSYTSNSSSPYTITPFNSVRWFNNDITPACMTTSLANGYTPNTTYRPNIKFENCGGSNPSAFTYTWIAAAGLSTTNTVSTIASPASTTVYTVQVNPIGQTNCMQAQTTTVTVINPVPATITPVSPLCTNASTLALSVIPLGGSWSGPGITPAGVLTPSACVIGANTYSYSVGTGSCSIYANTTINVEQFVPSTITGTINPICISNPTINLATALSTSTLGVGTWSGAGVTGTIFDPVAAGAGQITLTYNTNSNPTTTLCPSTSSIVLSVNSAVQPTITPAGPYCDNFIGQQMIANPTGGVWSAGSVGASITNTGVFSPSSSTVGSNKIYYTVTSAPCVKVDSTLIDVVNFIPATITGTVGPFCIYDAATNLQAIAQFTGGVWSGNGVTGTTFTPATALAGISVATYSTDPAPSGLCPDTKTISILVNDKPEANAVASNLGGCNYPWTVDFSTTTVNTGEAIWNFGDGTPNDTGLVVSHVFTTPGTYTATIYYTDNIGCKDTTQALTAVTIFSVPVAAFEPSLDITTVIDAEITFANQTSDLLNNTYTWDFGGLGYSTDISPLFLFTNSGEYFVTLIATSPEGCQDTAVKKVTINPDVVLYVPNAFTPGNNDGLNDVFQIFLPPTGVDFTTFDLKIYDRWGELIYRTNDVNKFWTGARNNSGDILKQDVYVWKITFMDTKKKYYEKLGHISLLRK
jgi:gliding motility-associated-like protein